MKQPIETRLERLERTPEDLATAIRGRNDAVLSRRPGTKTWSAKEVVCHLRDIEEQFILRFRTMLAMDNPKFLTLGDMPRNPTDWGIAEEDGLPLDPDRWAEERQYLSNDTGLALAAFRKRREETLRFLRRLTPEQWRRGSIHTTLGHMTFSDWVALVAAHDDKHVHLGHNYMEPALYYTIPDFTGDSLELSRKAATTDKEIIVFCGVRFMAETAKVLNPSKTVLLPAEKAGCSLAASITSADVRHLKARFPGVPVVTYINTYTEVKAESDICCTSSNAKAVIESLQEDTVIFLPDEFLARNVAKETGKQIIFPTLNPADATRTDLDYQIIGWHGRCEVHEKFTGEDVHSVRAQFPNVVILAHPECSPEVVAAADFSGSTMAMIKFVENTSAPHYLLLTECAMGDNVAAANPDKDMLRLCGVRCPHMNQITMDDTLKAIKYNRYEIAVPEDIRVRAARALERMIAIG